MIVFLQNKLLHYRKPFYNALSKHHQVVVIHSGNASCGPTDNFKEIVVPVQKIGPFLLQRDIHNHLLRLPVKAVIAMFDVRWLNTLKLMFYWDKKVSWIWWGLDEGGNSLALKAKLWIARRNNPIVFYTNSSLTRFANLGVGNGKLFLGNNTFHVPNRVQCYLNPNKNKFINVGSLDWRKQNEVTIRTLKRVREKTGLDLQYILVGDGEARQQLEELISLERLEGKVLILSSVNDPAVLQTFYSEAIASISFGQAGLAVLQSMAYGVPFVTKENAISGGEKSNILTGYNSVFCDDDPNSLESVMIRLVREPTWARQLGEQAYNYYSQHCTIDNMINGFLQALEYKENK
jgi:glycosyltransferase involved in cell wall biosynthesis